mmetsp:Transcript_28379/g.50695  ORF Transcript_28379/g.50695 Transcript_28379/m.50695 type:complete len:291 (-) Transcript_28379:880-1752(-)
MQLSQGKVGARVPGFDLQQLLHSTDGASDVILRAQLRGVLEQLTHRLAAARVRLQTVPRQRSLLPYWWQAEQRAKSRACDVAPRTRALRQREGGGGEDVQQQRLWRLETKPQHTHAQPLQKEAQLRAKPEHHRLLVGAALRDGGAVDGAAKGAVDVGEVDGEDGHGEQSAGGAHRRGVVHQHHRWLRQVAEPHQPFRGETRPLLHRHATHRHRIGREQKDLNRRHSRDPPQTGRHRLRPQRTKLPPCRAQVGLPSCYLFSIPLLPSLPCLTLNSGTACFTQNLCWQCPPL